MSNRDNSPGIDLRNGFRRNGVTSHRRIAPFTCSMFGRRRIYSTAYDFGARDLRQPADETRHTNCARVRQLLQAGESDGGKAEQEGEVGCPACSRAWGWKSPIEPMNA